MKLYVVDGHSLMYRAVYARMAELTSPSGEPTKGTYLFTRALLKLCRQEKPDYLCVALDGHDSSANRRKVYPKYKANRKHSGSLELGIFKQFERIEQIIRALGIKAFSVSGFEADDIIATCVERFASMVESVVIVSRDKDLHQLITGTVTMWDPMMDEVIGPAEVENVWEVPPSKVVEVQTLMGDATDNVPGVKRVGKVRAVKLIKRYGTASNVQRQARAGKMHEDSTLANALAVADLRITRALVELRKDTPLPVELEDIRFTKPDMKGATPIFRALGFQRWSTDDEPQAAVAQPPRKNKRDPAGPLTTWRSRGFLGHRKGRAGRGEQAERETGRGA